MSSNLQRLAEQAEESPLFRSHGGLAKSREGKELQRDLRDLARRGLLAKAEIAVHTNVAEDAMEGLAEVDRYRCLLAGNDETLNQALAQVELNYLHAVSQSQRKVNGNIFGL